MCLENVFGDGCGNERNTNKELFLLIEDYLVYNIVWTDKLNTFFSSIRSSSFLLSLNPDHICNMSFSSQKAIRYLVKQFQYCLLSKLIKTVAMLKCQQFEDSESEEMEPRLSKR